MKNWLRKRLLRVEAKFGHLRNFPPWRIIRPWYYLLKIKVGMEPVMPPDQEAISFYSQNAERINAVANMLADERSRRVYLKAWQYRQYRKKCDFPPYDWRPQYFKMFKFGGGEVFIDCGAFVGDTLDGFIKQCPAYKKIVAFEPNTKTYAQLQAKHGNTQDATLLNVGAYDKEGEVFFSGQGGSAAITAENQKGVESIRVNTIDNLNLEKATFIKMDIEGAELNALKGAEKTILRDKPKLAICIYHSLDDMVRIAEYLHRLVPEYRLRVNHYECYPVIHETVLYAHV